LNRRAFALWVAAGAAAFALLPWSAIGGGGFFAFDWIAQWPRDVRVAPALFAIVFHQRWWLLPVAIALLLPLAASAIAPIFACVFGLLQGIAPAGTVTEAYTWLSTGIAAGLAAGAALSGALAEAHGAGAAFVVAGTACAAGAFAGMARRRTLNLKKT